MKTNSFTVQGFICKDAEVKEFDKAAIARFGVIIGYTEHKGNKKVTTSSILNMETWVKSDNKALLELLKKGSLVTVEGFFKPESYTKDDKTVTVIKNIATKISAVETEAKEDKAHAESKEVE